MDFFFNGFMAALGATAAIGTLWFVWRFGPYFIIFMGPVVLPKRKQAEFIRDLKKDPFLNAGAIRVARRFGWHEGE